MSSPPILFDRALLRARRTRAGKLGESTFLLDRVAQEMSDRLATIRRRFECAIDLGTPSDVVRGAVMATGKVGTMIAADALAGTPAPSHYDGSAFVVAADEEALPFRDASVDLVVSALTLQFVNDLPGTLIQIGRALKPDGLLLAGLAGGDTLTELRQAFAAAEAEVEHGISPRIAPFADVREIGMLLQRAGFALPVTDVDRIVARYDSAFALMADLRGMGATNVLVERRRTPTRRTTMLRMTEIYAERFADADGRIRATFDVIWLSGWAPHQSQQQPLQPGSAKTSLAEAVRRVKR